MINVYTLQVQAACPVHNGQTDLYEVMVTSAAMIEVEKILEFFAPYSKEKIFQEELAARAATSLGAQVEIVGIHSGVKVRCSAP